MQSNFLQFNPCFSPINIIMFKLSQVIPLLYTITGSNGQEKEKSIEEFIKLLTIFEEGIQKDFPGKSPLFDDDNNVNFLGIVVTSYACVYPAFHEAVAVIISKERNATFLGWADSLREYTLVKETLPNHHRLVERLRAFQARLS